MAAGGFEHGVGCGRPELFAPGLQGDEAGLGVVELGMVGTPAQKQAGVEFGFGDVETRRRSRGWERIMERGLLWRVEVKTFWRHLRLSAGLSAVYNH